MKARLLVPLSLCALLLTACYRQTEEPFQQVDSAEVATVAATGIEAVLEDGADTADTEGGDATRQYVTPEALPGQVEQPTVELPTETPIEPTAPPLTVTPFIRPTATTSFQETLDPDHECVYTVQLGDNLFRLSLNWGTTVNEIMDASQIDSDVLSIGQLLLRPGCEYSAPTASPTEAPAPIETEALEEPAEGEAGAENEAVETATPDGPRIHVVSAGETIESISLRYRVDFNQLIELNNLADPNRLAVGQELLLPE